MKPKKNPGADLRSRRGLFFEIGMLAALAVAVAVFSIGQEESSKSGFEIPLGVISDTERVPPTVEKPKENKVKIPKIRYTGSWKPVSNDNYIDPNKIWDEWDADPDINLAPIHTGIETITEDPVFIIVDDMPKFMGGDLNTFRSWVLKRIKYPEVAKEINLQGKVVLQFVVEKDGTLSNIEVVRTPDRLLSDEAVRVLASSPKWEPGRQRNNPVRIRYTLPVDFILQN